MRAMDILPASRRRNELAARSEGEHAPRLDADRHQRREREGMDAFHLQDQWPELGVDMQKRF